MKQLQTNTQQPVENGEEGLVRAARQTGLKIFTKHSVLVTRKSNGLLAKGERRLSESYLLVTTAIDVMKVLPQRPFYIHMSNFSHNAVRLPKHMAIAQATEPPTVVHAIYAKHRRCSRLGTTEEGKQAHPISTEDDTNGLHNADDISAV